jgi:5-methylcytosine-specific restriction endonuclease McrA
MSNEFGLTPNIDIFGNSIKKKHKRQPVGSSQKSKVFDKQGGYCWKCKHKLKLSHTHYHHLKHVSKGGKSTTGNLVALCANCHSEIHKNEKAIELDRKKGSRNSTPKQNNIFGIPTFKQSRPSKSPFSL